MLYLQQFLQHTHTHGRKLPPETKMSEVWKRTPHPSMPEKGKTGKPILHNCQECGHSACYTKCSEFPKPKQGSPLSANKTFESNLRREGVSSANVVSGISPSRLRNPAQ
ncbi:hypothetical protein TNCV_1599931 [Trichonephila clavipes]|nr:hypothetical protein TNCV_1599931 [Trichonephila clavipes]